MIYILLCNDKPRHLQTRLDNRPAHVEYLNDLDAAGTLRFAGPFLDDDGKPNGSMVALEAASEAEARQIADADPYAKAGLFESVDIKPWNWVFKKPDAA
ncbi:YciI-like protein [Aliihoeflea sp. PC F10.4]